MSVEIKITDPSTTKPEELRAVIALLAAFAGTECKGDGTGVALAAISNDAVVTKVSEAAANRRTVGDVVAQIPPIAPDDNPAAGAPSAAEVFTAGGEVKDTWLTGETVTDAAAIFGVSGPMHPAAAAVFGANVSATNIVAAQAMMGTAIPNVPAAPAASAPAPVAAPAPSTNSVQLDKHGLPWDSRIHASTRAMVQDGSWKKRRGVDDAEVARVEAELRQVMGAPVPNAPPAASPVAPVPAAPIAVPPSPPAAPSAPNVPPAPVAGAATGTTAGQNTATATSALTFPQLMPKITAAVQSGTLTQGDVLAACKLHNLPSLPMLAARPDLVGAVAAALGLS